MDLLLIKVQSCTDLITNSSSEIFMLRTNDTVEQVESALSTFTSGYFKPILFNLSEYRKHKDDQYNKYSELKDQFTLEDGKVDRNSFWEALNDFNKEHPELVIYNTIREWFLDSGNREDILSLQKKYLNSIFDRDMLNSLQLEFRDFLISKGYDPDNHYYENIPDELAIEFINSHTLPSIEEMLSKSIFSGDVCDLDGCIIVLSEGDNTIPYEDLNIIENMYNGIRYHLG